MTARPRAAPPPRDQQMGHSEGSRSRGAQTKRTEKQELEKDAVIQLVSFLAKRRPSLHIKFDTLLDPPLPDARCIVNGSPVYVEVTHIYGTDADARRALGRKGRAEPTHAERLNSCVIPLRVRLFNPLNEVLRKKATKTYPVLPLWLLIRNALPIWREKHFREYLSDVVVPESHPFQRIWFLCGTRDAFGMIELTRRHKSSR